MCAPEDTSFSLYCALHRATLEIAGEFHHRQRRYRRPVSTRLPGLPGTADADDGRGVQRIDVVVNWFRKLEELAPLQR